jgi:hypothetical protein
MELFIHVFMAWYLVRHKDSFTYVSSVACHMTACLGWGITYIFLQNVFSVTVVKNTLVSHSFTDCRGLRLSVIEIPSLVLWEMTPCSSDG